jgi:hypothetical protein
MINNNPIIENAAEHLQHPYASIKANAYDMVLNGNEIGGGSIRIYQRELQEKMFEALGMDKKEQQHKFGFLLGAFEYGAPPHGGIAFGFDRLCAILGGSESIRDFIAFPKNNSGRDVMLDAPATIDEKQLEELQLDYSLKLKVLQILIEATQMKKEYPLGRRTAGGMAEELNVQIKLVESTLDELIVMGYVIKILVTADNTYYHIVEPKEEVV